MSRINGTTKIRSILKEICGDPGLRFSGYDLQRDSFSNVVNLVIWRGDQLFEPIPVRAVRTFSRVDA